MTTPKAQIITTEGQMIELYDDINANALFFSCIAYNRNVKFLKIELDNQIKFIPLHRIKEVVFFDFDVEEEE